MIFDSICGVFPFVNIMFKAEIQSLPFVVALVRFSQPVIVSIQLCSRLKLTVQEKIIYLTGSFN